MEAQSNEPSALTVRLAGDLISTNIPAARAMADLVRSAGDDRRRWRDVEVDLTEAKMVDSVGLNLIVAAFKAVQQGGGKMLLRYSNANVHRTFQFTRLGRYMNLVKV